MPCARAQDNQGGCQLNLSSSPHAHSFVLGPDVINNNRPGLERSRRSDSDRASERLRETSLSQREGETEGEREREKSLIRSGG